MLTDIQIRGGDFTPDDIFHLQERLREAESKVLQCQDMHRDMRLKTSELQSIVDMARANGHDYSPPNVTEEDLENLLADKLKLDDESQFELDLYRYYKHGMQGQKSLEIISDLEFGSTQESIGVHSRPGYDALWLWFSLSYASWLTLPRVLIHEMPDDWQCSMAKLMDEWDETWVNYDELSFLSKTSVCSKDQKNKFSKIPSWVGNYRHPDRNFIESLKYHPVKEN